jgi:hypothetical protein
MAFEGKMPGNSGGNCEFECKMPAKGGFWENADNRSDR